MYIKVIHKLIIMILMSIMIITAISPVVMATNTGITAPATTGVTPSEITGEGQSVTTDTINTAGKKLVGILQAVGVVLSVVVLIIIGIKYMLGSAEEKAEYKKTLMPYIVGAALIFAASMFAQIAYDFFTGF